MFVWLLYNSWLLYWSSDLKLQNFRTFSLVETQRNIVRISFKIVITGYGWKKNFLGEGIARHFGTFCNLTNLWPGVILRFGDENDFELERLEDGWNGRRRRVWQARSLSAISTKHPTINGGGRRVGGVKVAEQETSQSSVCSRYLSLPLLRSKLMQKSFEGDIPLRRSALPKLSRMYREESEVEFSHVFYQHSRHQ